MGGDLDRVAAALPAYDVGEEIGRGGFGRVYEGVHRHLGRDVAIKQLDAEFATDEAVRARFVTEAQLLASLDHPHVVRVYDFVQQDDLCLLVMEKLPGGTLTERFETGVRRKEACAYTLATCAGLQHAHEHSVMHRDIKPDNLLFSSTGTLKVTDFGIAKVVGGHRTALTQANEIIGTPWYMAPEQAQGTPVGPETDVYAAGMVLYELLSGQLPFSDDGDTMAILFRHVYESPTPLLELAPEVPTPIATVVMRAIATAKSDRYPDAESFATDLEAAANGAWGADWLKGAGTTVISGRSAATPLPQPTAPIASPATPAPVAPTVLAPAPPPPPHSPRRGRRWLIGVLVVLAAAAAAVVVVLSRESDKTPDRPASVAAGPTSTAVTATTRPQTGMAAAAATPARQFFDTWRAGDRAAAERVGSAGAVTELFAVKVPSPAPAFNYCDDFGSYLDCYFPFDDKTKTLVIRVKNDPARGLIVDEAGVA